MELISLRFIVFLALSLIAYWFILKKTGKLQNATLLVFSGAFYGGIDPYFLLLLGISTIVNFLIAIGIHRTPKEAKKKLLYLLGLLLNIGLLFYFKYFNFFVDSFISFLNYLKLDMQYDPLDLILPVGISFYTFSLIGYIIDVYNEEIEPSTDLLAFASYTSFFPKLLAGPIERAQHFLPQIKDKRHLDSHLFIDGLRQVLWGIFAKVAIADNLAPFVMEIFNNYQTLPASSILLGLFLYLIQVYCDFSGYSNIAIGISKLFGIRLSPNFAYPFFSYDISSFWKKWHISLTSWIMDYVFTPISFTLRRNKKVGLFISIGIAFLIVGLWHGANWTFVLFGILQSIYFVPLILKGNSIMDGSSTSKNKGALIKLIKGTGLFLLLMFTFVLLLAENIGQAFNYISAVFRPSIFEIPQEIPYDLLLLILFLFFVEWKAKNMEHPLALIGVNWPRTFRWATYYFVVLLTFYFGASNQEFIYFKF